ncbi:phospholipase [Qipengyuania atrilutea]|uniref:Phospholipase n=1 Tax=Qipengyuania atrilutea TaxID=2744473 RepID=A0A850GZV5_9SPHN|nr:phospholipase [Actirhodobacter atriluteus]NVD45161.1 phospholipase [Actirhodobacter atriluteus]
MNSSRTLLFPLLSATLLVCSGCASTGPLRAEPLHQVGQHPHERLADEGYAFQLFLPRSLSGEDEKTGAWPLMIFLHGSGERGDDVARVKVHGPPKHADRDPDFPFILISPQLPAEQDWDIMKLEAILAHALETLPVDPQRIYLTGLSRGGHATWRWGAAEQDKFAALAPVAGRGDPETACRLTDIPVWAFHGDRDDVVIPEGSFAMSRAIRACGGRMSKLTIYPDLGHNAWDPAYADPELYLWLLSQRLDKAGQ